MPMRSARFARLRIKLGLRCEAELVERLRRRILVQRGLSRRSLGRSLDLARVGRRGEFVYDCHFWGGSNGVLIFAGR